MILRQVLCLSLSWAVLPLIALPAPKLKNDEIHLSSPNGRVSLTFALKVNPTPYAKGKRPYYAVAFKGNTVITDSSLGLTFEGAEPPERHFELINVVTSSLTRAIQCLMEFKKLFQTGADKPSCQ